MSGKHSPQTHLKRLRERTKQEKRLEKLARRQQRNELKRAAKQSGDSVGTPVPDQQAGMGVVAERDVNRDDPARP